MTHTRPSKVWGGATPVPGGLLARLDPDNRERPEDPSDSWHARARAGRLVAKDMTGQQPVPRGNTQGR